MSDIRSVDIRAAMSSDLPALVALDAACFDAAERWGELAWQAELEGTGLVMVVDARRPGSGCELYGDLAAAITIHLAGDSAELYRVMTAPDWRGMGLATLLLAKGFNWAREMGASEMMLEVREDNRARSLYADLGFTPAYERTNYYGPGLHALVMRRVLEVDANE